MAKPPVVAFGSLKGGVGKTTVALCAAELLRAPDNWRTPADPAAVALMEPYPVLLIDADVVGTELAWIWKHPAYEGAPVSVQEWLTSVDPKIPDDLETFLKAKRSAGRGILVPSFPHRTLDAQNRTWARVFEEHGAGIVTDRLRGLVELARRLEYAVVLDLPAFDVGFAHHAREAVEQIQGERPDPVMVFTVTDLDLRSAFAVAGNRTSWDDVVFNRCETTTSVADYVKRVGDRIVADNQPTGAGGAAPAAVTAFVSSGADRAIVVLRAQGVWDATTNPEPAGAPNPMPAAFAYSKLLVPDPDHARRLRGWRG